MKGHVWPVPNRQQQSTPMGSGSVASGVNQVTPPRFGCIRKERAQESWQASHPMHLALPALARDRASVAQQRTEMLLSTLRVKRPAPISWTRAKIDPIR